MAEDDRLARDKQQAAELGYELVALDTEGSGQTVEIWGRADLATTIERTESDGWMIQPRDSHFEGIAQPYQVGRVDDDAGAALIALQDFDDRVDERLAEMERQRHQDEDHERDERGRDS